MQLVLHAEKCGGAAFDGGEVCKVEREEERLLARLLLQLRDRSIDSLFAPRSNIDFRIAIQENL